MVRKKAIALSLMFLGSGLAHSDDAALLSNQKESDEGLASLAAVGDKRPTEEPMEQLHAPKLVLPQDVKTILAELSPEVRALARQELIAGQLSEIADTVVAGLVNVIKFTDVNVSAIRAQLRPIAGEDRQAAVEAINKALQVKMREVSARLADPATSPEAILTLRAQSDHLRTAEAGLAENAAKIVNFPSEADAEMAAMFMPGSPWLKRVGTQAVAGAATGVAVMFGILWRMAKGTTNA